MTLAVLNGIKAAFDDDGTLQDWAQTSYGAAFTTSVGAKVHSGDAYPRAHVLFVSREYDEHPINSAEQRKTETYEIHYTIAESNTDMIDQRLTELEDHFERILGADPTIGSIVTDNRLVSVQIDEENDSNAYPSRILTITIELEN